MKNLFDALKMISFPIHKEGYKFIAIFFAVAVFLTLLDSNLGIVGLILTVWCIFFFRDPVRVTPIDKNLIISPADGVVTKIEYGVPAPAEIDLEGGWNKISIFLNVFNVHVNKAPISGIITKIRYKKGEFLSANDINASEKNERNSIIIKNSEGKEVLFSQVAGLVARRIVCEVKEGEKIEVGQTYGLIRFGSRLDVYLDLSTKIEVMVGQTMIAGETIIARFNNQD